MPQQVRRRKQRTINYSANNKVSENVSRGVVYRELYLRLTGNVTLASADNTSANTKRGDEWSVIKKIELIANGTDTIKSISGDRLWWLNYFLMGRPRITPEIGDGSTTDPAFDSVLILPLWMPGVRKPIDTALDSRELSSLEVVVTWGDATSINDNATGWTTEPKIDVYSLDSFNVEGPFSQWRVFEITKTITADNPEFEIEFPIGQMYRGAFFEATDGGTDASDIINNIKIVSGSTTFYDMSAQDDVIQQVEDIRKGRTPSYDGAGNQYDDLRRSADSLRAGWYFWEQVTDGFLTESIDTIGFSELKATLDVSVGAGTTQITMIPMQVVPIRGGNG